MNLEKIGNFIANERKKKGYTQADLAERLGVSDKAISKWERGLCLMDMSLLNPLAEELGVTINDILAGEIIKDDEELKNSTMHGLELYQANEKRKRRKYLIVSSVFAIILGVIGCIVIVNYIFNIPIYGSRTIVNYKSANKFFEYLNDEEYEKLSEFLDYPFYPSKEENLIWNETTGNTKEDFIKALKDFNAKDGRFISLKPKRLSGILNSLEVYYDLCAEFDNESACISITIYNYDEDHIIFSPAAMCDADDQTCKYLISIFSNPKSVVE